MAIQHVIDAVSLGSLFALLALGIAVVFGIMRLINFAHGEIIMAAAYAMYLFNALPIPLLVIVTVLAAVLFALLTERLAFRPLRMADPATLMVTSFAVSFIAQNLAIILSGARAKAVVVPQDWLGSWQVLGAYVGKLDFVITLTTIALLIGLAVLLRYTDIGLQMRAAAEDFRMARLLGVRAQRMIPTGFIVSGVLAGIAGFLYIAKVGTFTPLVGLPLLLAAVVSAVVGGLGSLVGAVIGGYVLGVFIVVLQIVLPANLLPYRQALVFTLVLLLLLIRPRGLMSVDGTRT
jgi:branched-chain amino acid transport system permease protein